jgi:hypothetical protein
VRLATLPVIADFAVVVVFDDPAAMFARIGQKLEPPWQIEDGAYGILVGRRHIEQADVQITVLTTEPWLVQGAPEPAQDECFFGSPSV